ncbi:MAG: DNA repair exonuclease, partial [Myxococcota bacterium]
MSAPAYRFLHAADLHLDSPFRGLSRHDPDLASRLRDASLVALTRMVDLAIDRECHFVVLAGDIYDGLERGVRAQLALKRAAVGLHDAGIPLVLLHGNHDPLDLGYTAVREWPASTHLLSATEPEVLVLDTPAGPVTITGQSFPDKRVERSLAAQYPPPSGPGLHVAVLHTELVWGEGTNPYSPCRLDDLVRTGFHYWALGHVHDPRVLHHRDPVVVYPGNLQGRHFLECGPRGAMLVEGAPQALRAEHQALAPLVFERVVVDVTELTDLTALQKALVDAIPAHDATRLLRAELEGRSSLFEALHDAERRQELLVALNDATADDAIWMEIRSSVRPDLPWDALAEQASLPGELVRRELDEAEA